MIFIIDDPLIILKRKNEWMKEKLRWRCFFYQGQEKKMKTFWVGTVIRIFYLAAVLCYIDVRFKGTHIIVIKRPILSTGKLKNKTLLKEKMSHNYFVHEIITNSPTHKHTHKYCLNFFLFLLVGPVGYCSSNAIYGGANTFVCFFLRTCLFSFNWINQFINYFKNG